MTHTPGPWRFDQTWALIYGPKKEEVAAIHAAQDGTRSVHPQTAHANARLIAAAPAMLTALEYLVNEWIEDHEDATADLHDDTCGYCYAQKVIAQARGEKS